MSNSPAPVTDSEIYEKLHKQEFIYRPMENVAVMFTSPITYYASWFLSQRGTRCEFFEKQWLECASSTSRQGAHHLKCLDELDDLKECVTETKSFQRYLRMQEERQKHMIRYQSPPPIDTFQNLRFKTAHHY